MMEGPPGADSEEKHEPASDIDTVAVDSLKALDPEWPIREARIRRSQSSRTTAGLDVPAGTVAVVRSPDFLRALS